MEGPTRRPLPGRQMLYAAVLLAVICILLAHQFTSTSDDDRERARARVLLQTIYELEQAHFKAHGTYLRIDRGKDEAVLKLEYPPGRFRYRVTVSGSSFVGLAEADLNGDGFLETWQVDAENPQPVLVKRD